MSLRYTQDELLQLKGSRTALKPAMAMIEGVTVPISDQAQSAAQATRAKGASRGKVEEAFPNETTPSKRPPFEPRGKSTNAREDIVLGPPKTSFASASGRNAQRPSFAGHDEEPKTDRTNFREKFSREGQRFDRDGDKSRDPRPEAPHNRSSVKEDSEFWSNARQQRTYGQDDSERPLRRNGEKDHERERDGGRDQRQQRGFENHRRDGTRDVNGEASERRAGPPRGRNESSWYRDQDRKDAAGDENPENRRPGNWREKDRRGNWPEPSRSKEARQELEPEWMDGPEPGDKSDYTQDDFEAWKASMKAEQQAQRGMTPSLAEPRPYENQGGLGSGTNAPRSKVDAPLLLSNNFVDGFFSQNEPVVAPKASKASKFSSMFKKPEPGPMPEPLIAPTPKESAPPSEDNASEDKAGFQRILTLLSAQQQSSEADATPSHDAPRQQVRSSPPAQSPRAGESNGLNVLFGTMSPPADSMSRTSKSEFLLKLMQQPPPQMQPDLSAGTINNRRGTHENAPRLPNFRDLMISPHETPQSMATTGPPPGLPYDALREEMGPRDKLNPNAGAERRAQPQLFDVPSNNGQRPTAQQLGMQPGMPRPPGFDQLPPGFPQNLQRPLRQNMGPPPGFAPPRGHNGFPQGLPPGLMQLQSDRGMQYRIPPNGAGMPPPPPGFPLGGPPPGFASMQFSPESMPYGGFDFGPGGPGFPPQQQRRQ